MAKRAKHLEVKARYIYNPEFEVCPHCNEWYVVGEFHGSEEMSTMGRMGDIRGRPNEEDLRGVKRDVTQLLQRM